LSNRTQEDDLLLNEEDMDGSEPETQVKSAPKKTAASPRLVFVLVTAFVGGILGAVTFPFLLEGISAGFAAAANATPFLKGLLGGRETVVVPYSTYPFVYPAMGLLGLIAGAGLANFIAGVLEAAGRVWDRLEIGDKVDLFLGIFTGIVLSFPFYTLFQVFGAVASPVLTLALLVGFSAMSVYVLKSIREVLPWHKSTPSTPRRSGIRILDTNVFIDGRLYDIAKTGFIDGELYVPQFVIQELQTIADASDPMRRQRGRRGLEVLRHLKAEFKVTVGTHDRHAADDREPVDARLVRLAKAVGADLVSNDYNLNKVARIQDVKVLNINDLALSLRPVVLPGELMEVHLLREGKEYGQAVGYLDDGTMVVVEGGRPSIGDTVEVTVTQVIQTERGKMIFASMEGLDGIQSTTRRRPR
jgi:uncharacterized protein YacL